MPLRFGAENHLGWGGCRRWMRVIHRSGFCGLLTVCFIIAACSTWVRYDFNSTFDFSTLKTFAWSKTSMEAPENKDLMEMIQTEVENQLQLKGFSIDDAHPDFVICAVIGEDNKLKASDFGMELNAEQQERITYEQATLDLTFTEADTGVAIWWGEALIDVEKEMGYARKHERVREAMDKLLKRFPPGVARPRHSHSRSIRSYIEKLDEI